MSSIRDTSRPNSNYQISNNDWSFGENDRDAIKLLIQRANTADLLTIFKSYGVDISDGYGGRKCCCPFPNHNDNSPSFYYYPDTNSFNCFGCKTGGSAVRFVSEIEKLNYEAAANKIVSNYYIDNNVELETNKNYIERQKIVLEFSSMIRQFIQDNKNDHVAIEYVEKLTHTY